MATRRPPARSTQTPAPPPHDPGGRTLTHPVFAQPQPTADPMTFKVHHPSDKEVYRQIDELNREHKLKTLAFPAPRGGTEPRLTFQDVLGGNAQKFLSIFLAITQYVHWTS